jgi:DNA-binding LacI/PurR family transcriptional regulator
MGKDLKKRNSASDPTSRQPIETVADLARYLDLSPWTVSRGINGHPKVKELTKQRIREAMTKLGFRPNIFARGLRGHGSGLVGVCFSGLGSPILNTKLYYLQEFLRRHQLRSLLGVSLREPETEKRVIDDFLNVRVEGIVMIYSALPANAASSLLGKIPCVCVDPHEVLRLPGVSLDRQKAMRLLLDHLLGLGHRSIALLGIGTADAWRWPALAGLARERGMDPGALFTLMGDAPPAERSIDAGRQMAADALRLKPRPTAFMCLDDQVAIGAIQRLHDEGVRVPRDVSVTGFDNLNLARQLHPTLTTIEQNPSGLMEMAGAMLLEQIRHGKTRLRRPKSRTVDPTLIIGESTAPAPAK